MSPSFLSFGVGELFYFNRVQNKRRFDKGRYSLINAKPQVSATPCALPRWSTSKGLQPPYFSTVSHISRVDFRPVPRYLPILWRLARNVMIPKTPQSICRRGRVPFLARRPKCVMMQAAIMKETFANDRLLLIRLPFSTG